MSHVSELKTIEIREREMGKGNDSVGKLFGQGHNSKFNIFFCPPNFKEM